MRASSLVTVTGAGLALLGTIAILWGFGSRSVPAEAPYGVSRVDSDPGIAIHWVLCDGVAARSVDLETYWGGSDLPTAVRVLWQVRSDSDADDGTRAERYVVGTTPPGFYETVPFRRELPGDLISISGPPGDETSMTGMSFRLSELRRDAILRGDYAFVKPEAFVAQGAASCRVHSSTPIRAAGVLALGLGGMLLAGRRHPRALLVAGVLLVGGIGASIVSGTGVRNAIAPRQPPSAFGPGVAMAPATRTVLLDVTSATTRSADGLYIARFLAPGPYSFAVSCDGSSIQIGEAAELVDGGTGSRQLIACATDQLVKGGIANRGDRGDVVELVVDPHGMRSWRVVVVGGSGEIGPFEEP
jgi:hypothetical protein